MKVTIDVTEGTESLRIEGAVCGRTGMVIPTDISEGKSGHIRTVAFGNLVGAVASSSRSGRPIPIHFDIPAGSASSLLDVLERVPQHMRDGVVNYVERGIRPGGFLLALFQNDLAMALSRADETNRAILGTVWRDVLLTMPDGSTGSPSAVDDWIAQHQKERDR